MRKIILNWLGISFSVSLIPIVLLGPSQGGIALSPIIMVSGLIIGFLGAGIHSSIYAFKYGNKHQRIVSLFFNFSALLFIGWTMYSSSTCNHNALYAKEHVVEYINSKDHLELSYLGEQHISHENCQSTFGYTDPDNTFIFIVSEFGKLHFNYE